MSDSEFLLKYGDEYMAVNMTRDSNWSLILSFQPPEELSRESMEILAARRAARCEAQEMDEAARPEGDGTSGLVGDVTSSSGPGSS
jgi:hypothetical protein